MTCAVGPAHPNSGDISVVDLFGALYVGGSGMWRFRRVSPRPSPGSNAPSIVSVGLHSERRLWDEMRAAVTIAMGFGRAREIVRKHSQARWTSLKLDRRTLQRVIAESDGLSIGLLVTSVDQELLDEVSGAIGETEWSVVLCGPKAEMRKTQWMENGSE